MEKKEAKEFSTKLDDLVELAIDVRITARKQQKRNRQEITRLKNKIAVLEAKES